MEQEENIIAEKIKNFRKAKKLSQKELSERSGINLSIIKKYETGYRNPKPDQLIKIANALEKVEQKIVTEKSLLEQLYSQKRFLLQAMII